MAMEEVDSLVLQEPADEVEVALAILHRVVTRGIALVELELEIGDRPAFEHRLHDLRYRLVLEDPAIPPPAEEPEPGYQLDIVAAVDALLPDERGLRDQTMIVTLAAALDGHGHGHAFAEQVLEHDIRARAQQHQLVAVEAPELFPTLETMEQEQIGSAGLGADRNLPVDHAQLRSVLLADPSGPAAARPAVILANRSWLESRDYHAGTP